MASHPQRKLSHKDYTVACVCPMGVEFGAVEGMLDKIHPDLPTGRDYNTYTLGESGGHNVVVVVMHEIGNNIAAATVTQLYNDFPSIRFGLLVGIGGGVPSETGEPDIRLGDVVVSKPTDTFGGVVQFDLGKTSVNGHFQRTGLLSKPPPILSGGVQKLQARHLRKSIRLSQHVSNMIQLDADAQIEYRFPMDSPDQLFISSYTHESGATCSECDPTQTVARFARPDHEPRIHYGTIGSSNMVVKDAATRDRLKKDLNILCVEMEAAGLFSNFPSLVIRGICDYADSHKNKQWQPYAAAVAAAYMKELLGVIPTKPVIHMQSAEIDTPPVQEYSGKRFFHENETLSTDTNEIDQRLPKRHRRLRIEDESVLESRYPRSAEQSELGDRHEDISYGESGSMSIRDRGIEAGKHDNVFDELRYKVLLDSLTFHRMDARQRNVANASPKTCDWLFRHAHFKAWIQDSQFPKHHGFLWIKGKPGSGKSTIMKTAWMWAKKRRRKKSLILSYFFNARSPHDLEKSSLGLYRSVVHQILCAIPASKPLFFEQFLSKERDGAVDEWTVEELQNLLIDVVKTDFASIEIFVDALDEGDEDDIRRMIGFLYDLGQHSQSSAMRPRICLSSRHYPSISIPNGLSLIVEDQPEHQKDIETYVRPKLDNMDDPHREALLQKVCLKADGIFLWVVLVVPMLKKAHDRGSSMKDMIRLLETIPKDLAGLFEDILKHVSDKQSCVLLLQWVLYSTCPLSPAELYLAIQYSEMATFSADVVIPHEKQLDKRILNWSHGLVEQTRSQPPVIQFIHETVRDFLIEGKGLERLQPNLTRNVQGQSHDILKSGCLRYIQRYRSPEPQDEFLGKRARLEQIALLKSTFPLIDYAVNALFLHADSAEQNHVSQRSFLEQTQSMNEGVFRTWVPWRNVLEQFKIRRYSDDVRLLYVLSENNLLELVKNLVSMGVEIDVVGGRYGTALQAACFAGHEDVVRLLLQHGADVNLLAGEYKYATLAAMYGRRPNIVNFLCQRSLSFPSGVLSKPLSEMIDRGDTINVQILKNHGADASKIYRGRTMLHSAAYLGNETLVQRRLDAGADIICFRGKTTLNALRPASAGGHNKVVEILLAAGADVNAEDGNNGTALQAASEKGFEKVVRILIDAGADVNAGGGRHGNALHAASSGGHSNVVQILLEAGAHVNANRGHYGSALKAASYGGHSNAVQILLDAGAHVNAYEGQFGSALQAASYRGRSNVVKVLLDAGADVNARRGNPRSALEAASVGGYSDVIRILLAAGADVHARGGSHRDALQGAAAHGSYMVVGLLLDAGADVNAPGGTFGTALQAAALCRVRSQDEVLRVMQRLVDAGADMNARGGEYGSALEAAEKYLGKGHEERIQLLLDAGATR